MKRPKLKWHDKPFPQRWEIALWLVFVALAGTFWALRWMYR